MTSQLGLLTEVRNKTRQDCRGPTLGAPLDQAQDESKIELLADGADIAHIMVLGQQAVGAGSALGGGQRLDLNLGQGGGAEILAA